MDGVYSGEARGGREILSKFVFVTSSPGLTVKMAHP